MNTLYLGDSPFCIMASHKGCLAGLSDVVAFDEAVGINFMDLDGVWIKKRFMASETFSRGRESVSTNLGRLHSIVIGEREFQANSASAQ